VASEKKAELAADKWPLACARIFLLFLASEKG
jgi:hypothetical protein